MQVDAAPLGVRYRAGFVAREREGRTKYSELPGSGEDRCEQAQAPRRAARYQASRLHLDLKVALRNQKGST